MASADGQSETAVSAAVLVIGDEILSGRTQDANSHYIAKYLANIGVDLAEIRVVPDVADEIVAAVNALRRRYTYVFTTGGIGPTHDDITADAVAAAFQVDIVEDPRAIAMLLERIPPDRLNAARRRMARIPVGAELVKNELSAAPGFMIENVIVMAGVPVVMQAMLDAVAPKLATGMRMVVAAVDAGAAPEGVYAAELGSIAAAHPTLSIGSYPHFSTSGVKNQIVIRGRDGAEVAQAEASIKSMLRGLTIDKAPG